ncbi:hypothetical protein J1N35_008800 [Gossypium stocksii]|uniref:DUF4219 domain-containing protein n=1 Tax=Gossypium stocksii TaxID=47602 RepID=A0A9D4AET7_9ROSI|nr:hypothetical protein J1N35_008800 [Gossypium stocksii]
MEDSFASRPPMLNGSNYTYWKARMKVFIKSIDEMAKCIGLTGWKPLENTTSGVKTPESKLTWTIEEENLANANSKALYVIFCGVGS